ncbi:MAG: two-component sensor histidine kinase, partial [Negativicutes bacterium]|nr:two-component sensor histidine kinase [Negativicutes bacterium]
MRGTALQLAEGDYLARNNLQLHDEIGQLANAMDLLSDRLLEASKEKAKLDQFRKDFIINLSHELRTPVTVIRGSLEALVDKIITSPEQITEYHKQMLAEAILLQRLI